MPSKLGHLMYLRGVFSDPGPTFKQPPPSCLVSSDHTVDAQAKEGPRAEAKRLAGARWLEHD